MKREHEVLENYVKRGYKHVHVRRDQAHFRYHQHYHPHHVTLHVLDGTLEVDLRDGKRVIVGPGDKLEIEAERMHATTVGPSGCVYVHAEKHRPAT